MSHLHSATLFSKPLEIPGKWPLNTPPDCPRINDLWGAWTSWGPPWPEAAQVLAADCPPGGVTPAEGTRGCAPSCNG
jgi:hypothetical protein